MGSCANDLRIHQKGNTPCVAHNIPDIKLYSVDQSTPIICLSSDPSATDQYHLLGLTTGRANDKTISYYEVPASFNGEDNFDTAFVFQNPTLRSTAGLPGMKPAQSLRSVSDSESL